MVRLVERHGDTHQGAEGFCSRLQTDQIGPIIVGNPPREAAMMGTRILVHCDVRKLTSVIALMLIAGSARAETTAYIGGVLVDGSGGLPVPASVVLVEGDRIAAAGPFGAVPIPAGVRVVNVAGRWLTPGLVDPHIHFFQSGGLYTRPDIVDLRTLRAYADEASWVTAHWEDVFRRYVASGVTAVVDVGGPFSNFVVRAFRDQVPVAPRVAVAGPLISTVSRPQLDVGDPPIIRAADAAEARAMVARQLERSPDLIKIWYIVPKDGDPRENLPLARAIIDAAHAGGVRVAVHATQLEAARAVVEAGADILVHSIDDAPVDDAFIALLKEKGTVITSTLVVYEGYGEILTGTPNLTAVEARLVNPAVLNSWDELAAAPAGTIDPAAMQARKEKMRARIPMMQANLKVLWDAGVVVAAGTDAGNIGTIHGPAMHRELELLAEAGLTPGEVLVAATRHAAQIFAPAPDFGTVAAGKLADFLILDADPLADVRALRRIHRVVLGGQLLDPDAVAPQDVATVFRRMHAAFAARDLEGIMALFAPGYRDTPLSGRGSVRELQEVREDYAKVFDFAVPSTLEVRDSLVTGDFIVEVTRFTPKSGSTFPEVLLIGQVADGRIQNTWGGLAWDAAGSVAPVQGQVDAYNARDIDAFASFYAEDLKIYRLPEGELILDGRAALHERYAKFFALSPALNCTVVKRLEAGPWVVDREVVTGARDGPPLRAVAVYRVEGGLIQAIWFLPREGTLSMETREATRRVRRITVIGAVVNLLLAGVKVVGGGLVGSVALVADGVHSLSDLLSDAVVLLGATLSARPPDENHPYGHGKFETFAAMIVAAILVAAGIGIALDAAASYYRQEVFVAGPTVLVIAGLSIVSKEALYRATLAVAHRTGSPSLQANAWHHRTDALSSVAVLAGALASLAGWPHGDQAAGVVVGVMILGAGASIGMGCLRDLSEHSIEEGTLGEIRACLDQDPGIRGWHHLRTRRVGREIFADVHVLLDPEISVSEGHRLVSSLEEAIRGRLAHPAHFTIHMEPDDDENRVPEGR